MRLPTFRIRKGSMATIAAAAVLVIATSGTSAVAAHLITSRQIKNGTIKGIDIHAATIPASKLVAGTIPAPYGGTSAYSAFHDAGASIASQVAGLDPTVLTLNIPAAGSYTVLATVDLFNSGGSGVLTRCTLNAAGDSDLKHVGLAANGAAGDGETATLQAVHTFGAPGVATLRCYSFGVNVAASNIKITATRVDHLTNSAG